MSWKISDINTQKILLQIRHFLFIISSLLVHVQNSLSPPCQPPFDGAAGDGSRRDRRLAIAVAAATLLAALLAAPRNAAAADPTAAALAQAAATLQAATASATVDGIQQVNAAAPAPGGSAKSSQSNVADVGSSAGNDASTTQDAAGDDEMANGAQQAATGQTAAANASASGVQQTNVVVVVRVNSPGNDSVAQTNVVNVGASSGNSARTAQGRGEDPMGPAVQAPTRARRILLAAAVRTSSADPPAASRPAPHAGTAREAAARAAPGASLQPHVSPSGERQQAASHAVTRRAGATPAARTAAASPVVPAGLAHGIAAGARLARDAAADARPQGGTNLGLLTVAALMTGLLGWTALTWAGAPALRRRVRRAGWR